MDIPKGYKQTELGIIPEDWQLQSVGKYCTVKARIGWQGLRSDEYLTFGEYGLITSTDIVNGSINWGTCYFVSKARYLQDSNIIVQEDDTLISKDGTIGKVGIVQNMPFPSTLNSGVFVIRPKFDSIYKRYLGCIFKSIYFQDFINRLTAGSTIVHLYQKDIVNFIYPAPTLVEQRAIAEALSDIDGLIAALDKKIAKKRLIKQGAMSKLLSLSNRGKKWFNTKLGCVVNIRKGSMLTSEEFIVGNVPVIAGGKTPAGYHNVANRPANTITISASGASAGYVALHNTPIFASDCSTIVPDPSYDIEYMYHLLVYYQSEIYSLQTGGAQPHVHPSDLNEMQILYASDIKTQQAIATILNDMDKEIADLEAKRDKYQFLKSGMMQKLLTGQIRLTKPLIKVVPLVPEASVAREIPLDAHILAGHIVNRLWQSKGWGRTKLQKSLHLIGYCVQLNLGNEYIRNTAGPDDQLLMNYIDKKFKQYRHVNIKRERRSDGTVYYSYIPTSLIQELEMAYEQYPQDIREHIDRLLDKLSTMNLAGAEILSTLYAVWNNRIIKGEQITDNLLLADFYAWSKHKADFEERRVRKVLDYMRKENIVPIGWGKYIDKR